MEKMLQIISDHISNWSKVWFGLIFIGSVLNAITKYFEILAYIPNLSLLSFGIGFFIGLIAKIRGKWLWI
jgi:hypothetical protein